jgi:hypothetical protein
MTEARTWFRETARLTALLLAIALATSRLGLLAHELVGHGGTTLLVGGRVTDVQLFWFAGGWIRYQFTAVPSVAAQIAIAMGGIAVEILCGSALWVLVRGPGFGSRLVRAIGATFVVHATWYFATGAWHGYGDGQLLYKVLGDARYPVAMCAGVITCIAGFFAAKQIVGALLATVSPRWLLILAAALAGGAHLGLAVGELALRHDTTYGEVMQPERERVVQRDLERWAQYEKRATPAQREQERVRLEQVHHTFPFAWLLGACAITAILLGAWRSQQAERVDISNRLLWRAMLTATFAIAAVIAIDIITR